MEPYLKGWCNRTSADGGTFSETGLDGGSRCERKRIGTYKLMLWNSDSE